jgi:hypothetical protein
LPSGLRLHHPMSLIIGRSTSTIGLRKCLEPSRQFVDIKEAWDLYEKSFG